MNLNEYIEKKNFKPLSDKEIAHGKNGLKIYGTQEQMPWTTIFARIESGQDIEEIGKQYGHARKIALFAKLYGVEVDEKKRLFVEKEASQRQEIQEIANEEGVEVAKTLLQRVNEVAPDYEKNLAIFANKMLLKAIEKLDDKFLEDSGMLNMSKAVQIASDTVGVTQRHASAANIHAGKIEVQGFTVHLDSPKALAPLLSPEDCDALDAELVTDDKDTHGDS